MLTVSNAFKAAILPGLTGMRKTAARVNIDAYRATIYYDTPDAVSVVNSEANFSDSEKILDSVTDNTYRIATNEMSLWKLDGSTVFPPATKSLVDVGYASNEVCAANGAFVANPAVKITTQIPFSSHGITLFFDRLSGDYPVEFDIDVDDSSTSTNVYHLAVTDNDSPYFMLETEINALEADCDTITITFKKMNKPYRRARMTEMFMGLKQSYGIGGSDNLISVDMVSETDPTCATLPNGTSQLKVMNTNGEFNLITPEGVAKYLMEPGGDMSIEIGVQVSEGVIEYTKIRTDQFVGWKDIGNKMIQIDGADPIGYYGDRPVKAIYHWSYAGNPQLYFYSTAVSTIGVRYAQNAYAYFPTSTDGWCAGKPADSARDFLREMAQWLCKIARFDEDGALEFVDIDSASSGAINLDDCYDDPSIEKSIPPQYIVVNYYNAVAGSTPETIVEYKETFTGTKSFSFDIGEDYSSVSVTVAGASSYGSTGVSNGIAYANDVVGTGSEVTITITGIKEIITKLSYTLENTLSGVGTVTIDNTHVGSATKAAEIAAWTLANYNKLLKFKASWRGDPTIEMGDMRTMETIHGDKDIIVTRQDLTFDGTLNGILEGVG